MGDAHRERPTRVGLYEPIHGSAPDIAGRGIANPVGTILSVALLLRYSLGLADAARAVESAVWDAIAGGSRTPDLGGSSSTVQVAEDILSCLDKTTLGKHRLPL